MAKVLVIDDSSYLRQQLRTVIEKLGHVVIEAADGEEGLRVAEAHRDIKLFITDFNMPFLNGAEMAERLRKLPEFSSTPIIVLTADSGTQSIAKAKSAGINVWVVKPFVEAKIANVIKACLEA